MWQDLATVYTELKQWRDAETCLEKAQALKTYSTVTWCATGEGFHCSLRITSNVSKVHRNL